MAFCKFSSQLVNSSSVSIDASFLNDYLPVAPESCVKIYLFGLLKCYNASANDNNIENFVNVLGYTKEDILSAFHYWQEQNLVQIINVEPFEVRYLPVKNSLGVLKKFKKDKYASFNISAQEIIEDRMISPNEYNEYYSLMESMEIEQAAMLMIIKYCADVKGKNINYPYIITVAKNWAYEGIRTSKDVEQKLNDLNLISQDLTDIAKALKYKGTIAIEYKDNYVKWKDNLGYDLGTIIYVAKNIKDKTRYKFESLDARLNKYFELNLKSIKEIEEYEANKGYLEELSRKIISRLRAKFYDVSTLSEVYLIDWIKKGYNEDTLMFVADFCMKKGKRDITQMDETINKLHKLGLISIDSINKYLSDLISVDQKIKEIINNHELNRKVTSYDRENYKTWTEDWNMSDEMIQYASSLAVGKSNVFSYINKILSNWHQNNIHTLSEAKKNEPKVDVANKMVTCHSFSKDDFDALFDNLDEVEL